MFASLRAKGRLFSAAMVYGDTPSEKNEQRLRAAFSDVIGRPPEQWSASDWEAYETTKAQRPT